MMTETSGLRIEAEFELNHQMDYSGIFVMIPSLTFASDKSTAFSIIAKVCPAVLDFSTASYTKYFIDMHK